MSFAWLGKVVVTTHVLLAAYLLIAIQPIVVVALLPFTGGHPLLWHFVQVLFQGLLLVGYLTATLVPLRFVPYLQVAGGLLLLVFPPLTILTDHPEVQSPLAAVIAVAAAVGPAFVVLATSTVGGTRMALAAMGHARPTRLYAFSNAGSLLAVTSYAFLVQPFFEVGSQLVVWRIIGIVVMLGGGVGWFSIWALRSEELVPPPVQADAGQREADSPWRWVLGGAAPVALSLAVTSYFAEGLGSHPVVWLGPFGCYLVSMIVAFSGYGRTVGASVRRVGPFFALVLMLSLSSFLPGIPMPIWIGANLVCIGAIFLCWNTWLWERRPAHERLGRFFSWIATGGFVGGLVAILAVRAFDPH